MSKNQGVTNFQNWKNKKLEEQFRRGIIKAANKTEMWFITNGINGGISAMVGEAFEEEKVNYFKKFMLFWTFTNFVTNFTLIYQKLFIFIKNKNYFFTILSIQVLKFEFV